VRGNVGVDVEAVEALADAAAQFARDAELLPGAGARDEPDDGLLAGHRLDALHFGVAQEQVAPLVLTAHVLGLTLDRIGGLLDVGPRVDRDVEDDLREALALVADAQHFTVADVPDRPVHVAQASRAQTYGFNRPARELEVDGVADAVLVLEHHEHAGQEVLDDVLSTEAERDTDDRCAGDERREVHVQVGQDQQHRDRHDGDRDAGLQHRADRRRALVAPLRNQAGRFEERHRDPLLERTQDARDLADLDRLDRPVDQAIDDRPQDQADDDRDRDSDRDLDQPVAVCVVKGHIGRVRRTSGTHADQPCHAQPSVTRETRRSMSVHTPLPSG
jgi:hypothetical protein